MSLPEYQKISQHDRDAGLSYPPVTVELASVVRTHVNYTVTYLASGFHQEQSQNVRAPIGRSRDQVVDILSAPGLCPEISDIDMDRISIHARPSTQDVWTRLDGGNEWDQALLAETPTLLVRIKEEPHVEKRRKRTETFAIISLLSGIALTIVAGLALVVLGSLGKVPSGSIH